MAAPTFVAASWAEDVTSTSPWTATCDVPSGTADGDIILAMVMVGAGSGVSNFPGDFTEINAGGEITGTNLKTWWLWRRASSEPANYTFALTSGGGGALGVSLISYRGCVASGTPFEDATIAEASAAETTPATAEITTTDTDRTLVCLCAIEDNTSFSSGYPPGSWNSRQNQMMPNGTDLASAIMDIEQATADTVAAVVVGTLGFAEWWASMTLALIPEPAAGSDVFNDRRTARRRTLNRMVTA